MKAAWVTKYGAPEVIEIRDMPKPQPKAKEILVKVKASGVSSGDARMRGLRIDGLGLLTPVIKFSMRVAVGFRGPRKVPGSSFSGIVEEVGSQVTKFKVGDEVFGMAGFNFGTHAEYAAIPEKRALALKPKKASFEEAAAWPFGGTTALYFLRKAGLGEGKRVLIYGASGSVGSSAIQIAKYQGAHVTTVSSRKNQELCKKLGADETIDYKKTTPAKIEGKFDIVFDSVGKTTKQECEHLLGENGKFITVASLDVAKELSSDLEILVEMFEAGKLDAVIYKTYPLEKIADAHSHVDTGHKVGNIILTIA